jgi:hypothetical protein
MVWNGDDVRLTGSSGIRSSRLVVSDNDVLAVGGWCPEFCRGQPPVLPENYELRHLSLKRTRSLSPPRAGWFANGSNRSPSACGAGREL